MGIPYTPNVDAFSGYKNCDNKPSFDEHSGHNNHENLKCKRDLQILNNPRQFASFSDGHSDNSIKNEVCPNGNGAFNLFWGHKLGGNDYGKYVQYNKDKGYNELDNTYEVNPGRDQYWKIIEGKEENCGKIKQALDNFRDGKTYNQKIFTRYCDDSETSDTNTKPTDCVCVNDNHELKEYDDGNGNPYWVCGLKQSIKDRRARVAGIEEKELAANCPSTYKSDDPENPFYVERCLKSGEVCQVKRTYSSSTPSKYYHPDGAKLINGRTVYTTKICHSHKEGEPAENSCQQLKGIKNPHVMEGICK